MLNLILNLLLLTTTTFTTFSTATPHLLPPRAPPSRPLTILTPFSILTHYPENPIVHNRPLHFWPAGGGDHHLYLGPTTQGFQVRNLTLVDGVLTTSIWKYQGSGKDGMVTIRGVVNGEYTKRDNTTKIFFTQRNDPRAVFVLASQPPVPEDPEFESTPGPYAAVVGPTEIRLLTGDVCVRLASGGRYEFRSSPAGNEGISCPCSFSMF
ncbi:hypothetical protein DFH27DRAFT_244845 [Peziza echinospora]|nr:hypothetical protein DFH27DRAFT_244845 [Peziza echinospora]